MGGIFTTNVYAEDKLSATTKLSAEQETPPIATVRLGTVFVAVSYTHLDVYKRQVY